jgi:hypothetical protein
VEPQRLASERLPRRGGGLSRGTLATQGSVCPLMMDKSHFCAACCSRYGLQSCRGKSAGVAKRRVSDLPPETPYRHDSRVLHRCPTQVTLPEVISQSKNLRAAGGRDGLASALVGFLRVPLVQVRFCRYLVWVCVCERASCGNINALCVLASALVGVLRVLLEPVCTNRCLQTSSSVGAVRGGQAAAALPRLLEPAAVVRVAHPVSAQARVGAHRAPLPGHGTHPMAGSTMG